MLEGGWEAATPHFSRLAFWCLSYAVAYEGGCMLMPFLGVFAVLTGHGFLSAQWPGVIGALHLAKRGRGQEASSSGGAQGVSPAIVAQKRQRCAKVMPEGETDPAWLQARPLGLWSGAGGAARSSFGSSCSLHPLGAAAGALPLPASKLLQAG